MREPWIRKKIRRRFDFKRLVLTRRYFVQNLQDEINAYPELFEVSRALAKLRFELGGVDFQI